MDNVILKYQTGLTKSVSRKLLIKAGIMFSQANVIDMGKLSPEIVEHWLYYASEQGSFNLNEEANLFKHAQTFEASLSAMTGLFDEVSKLLDITEHKKSINLGTDLNFQMMRDLTNWTDHLINKTGYDLEDDLISKPVLAYLVYNLLNTDVSLRNLVKVLESKLFKSKVVYNHTPIKLIVIIPLIAVKLYELDLDEHLDVNTIAQNFLNAQNHYQRIAPLSGQDEKIILKLELEYDWLLRELKDLGYQELYKSMEGLKYYFNQFHK